jgi:hypothetical protein
MPGLASQFFESIHPGGFSQEQASIDWMVKAEPPGVSAEIGGGAIQHSREIKVRMQVNMTIHEDGTMVCRSALALGCRWLTYE